MNNKIQMRSLSLDILKLFLSFFVVTGHLRPLFGEDSFINPYISDGFCRVLVPCFFLISGFFLMPKLHDKKYFTRYIFQLFVIYVVWSTFYLQFYYEGTSLTTILGRYIFGWYQLWYLPALFTGAIFLLLATKWVKNDIYLFIIVLFIYFMGHILDVTRVTSGVMAQYYRNGFFIGFPFLYLGYLIRKYDFKTLLSTKVAITTLILGLIVLFTEVTVYTLDGNKFSDLYLGALLICPSAVIICLRHPFKVKNSIFVEYFSDISTGIYFIHLFFVFKMMHLDYNIYMLPVIFLTSILASIPIIFINRHLPMRLLL